MDHVRDFEFRDYWRRFRIIPSTFFNVKLTYMTLTYVMLQVRAILRPLLLLGPPMAVGKSGLGFRISQSIAEI